MTDSKGRGRPKGKALPTTSTTVRLSPEAIALWQALSEDLSISRRAVLEVIIRKEAEKRGLTKKGK